jgi:hypothetical protein
MTSPSPAILEFLAQTGRLRSDLEEGGDDGGTDYEDDRVSMEHEPGVGT